MCVWAMAEFAIWPPARLFHLLHCFLINLSQMTTTLCCKYVSLLEQDTEQFTIKKWLKLMVIDARKYLDTNTELILPSTRL